MRLVSAEDQTMTAGKTNQSLHKVMIEKSEVHLLMGRDVVVSEDQEDIEGVGV